MINITEQWKYLYKFDYNDLNQCTTNMLYTPMINPQGNILCMIYDKTEYLSEDSVTKELIDFFFERELKYLKVFQGYRWAPTIQQVDESRNYIFTDFNKETLNHIITDPNRSLDVECSNWKEQIWEILKDLDKLGYYKVALYPHCFFLDENKQIKTIDFYSCIEKNDCLMERSKIEGIIGKKSTSRFDDSTENGFINFQRFFEITMLEFLSDTWGYDNPFPDFYRKLKNV